ncbi:MAG: DUF4238 domain-containing protein, partial [bacterium]|nr:DUF4238 domain-containing protein [bacterium]
MEVVNNSSVKNKGEPRRHHYIPEFYLANFTSTGQKDDFLWVLDKKQAKQWKAIPKNIAHQRDFYRIDVDELEPSYIETALSEIEEKAAPVMKEMSERCNLPKGDDFIILMNFVALMAVRVPRPRNNMSDFISKICKSYLRLTTATPERWESTASELKKKGCGNDRDVSYEKMKRFVDKD